MPLARTRPSQTTESPRSRISLASKRNSSQVSQIAFVMVSERAGSVQTLREHLRDQIARQQFDRLDGDGPTLH
jgi:hypothetical protein